MTYQRITLVGLFLLCFLSPLILASDALLKDQKVEPLKVVLVEDNAPFSLLLPDGTPTGLYVEFWQLWSKVNKVPIEFIPGSFANNMALLRSKKADFHVGLFSNEQRSKWGDFSLAIHKVDTGLFFNSTEDDLPSLDGLKGRKVAVQLGTYQQNYLKQNYPEVEVIVFDDAEMALKQLLENKFDAILSEVPYLNAQIAKMGLRGVFRLSREKILINEVHAFVPRGNRNILATINAGIQRIPVDQIIALERKWLPELEPYFSSKEILKTLSLQEKNWLKSHPNFSLGIDHNWSPFEYIDEKNQFVGVSSEYVKLLAQELAIQLNPRFDLSWSQAFELLKIGKVDVMSGIVRTDERAKMILFTNPYVSLSSVITTRKDGAFVQGMDDLFNKKVAVIKGYVFEDYIRKNHPDITVVGVASIREGLNKVENKEIDAFIDALATINHELGKEKHNNVIVAAFTPYKLELSMGVRKGLEPLVPILNKALSTISTKDKSRIANNWLSVEVNVATNYQAFFYWGVPIFLILLSIIWYVLRSNRRMQFEILERKKVERSLEKSKQKAVMANQAKDNFLANMSHEIRTPMNAVVGMSHLLEESGLNKKQQGYNRTLNNSAASLLILIDDILDLSKVEAGKLEIECLPFKLIDIISNIEEQVRLIIDNQSIQLKSKIDKNLPNVLVGDAIRIGQIILNLANNAAKFTKQGSIDINVKVLEKGDGDIKLQISIRDTGIGMNSEEQRKLFKTYSQADSSTTRKYGGTGLGLTISKKLCELMSGEIWMESTPGKGSHFYFTVKLKYKKHKDSLDFAITKTEKEEDYSLLFDKHILLVDDNEINLTVAKTILTNAGIRVVTATNGLIAVEKLDAFNFDAILMDIQMPVMDGYEATKYIRDKMLLKDLPIIAVSANVMKTDIQKSLEAGMNAHIGKPLNVQFLLKTLCQFLTNSQY